MYQIIQGAQIPGSENLREGYRRDGSWLYANVSAERLDSLFRTFLRREGSELFSLFLEQPSNLQDESPLPEGTIETFHVDVYYLDGISENDAIHLLDLFGPLLIHDGMVRFGFASERGNELGKYKFGEIYAFSHSGDLRTLRKVFETAELKEIPDLKGPWDLISRETPGRSWAITLEDRKVSDVIEALKQVGLYFAERRED